MSITIGDYNFEGPYFDTNSLFKRSGVFVILGKNAPGNDWQPVDIGAGEDVRDRVQNHGLDICWSSQGYRTLVAAVLYCEEPLRDEIALELRELYRPPCGRDAGNTAPDSPDEGE